MFITQLTTLIKPREEAIKPGIITSHNITTPFKKLFREKIVQEKY